MSVQSGTPDLEAMESMAPAPPPSTESQDAVVIEHENVVDVDVKTMSEMNAADVPLTAQAPPPQEDDVTYFSFATGQIATASGQIFYCHEQHGLCLVEQILLPQPYVVTVRLQPLQSKSLRVDNFRRLDFSEFIHMGFHVEIELNVPGQSATKASRVQFIRNSSASKSTPGPTGVRSNSQYNYNIAQKKTVDVSCSKENSERNVYSHSHNTNSTTNTGTGATINESVSVQAMKTQNAINNMPLQMGDDIDDEADPISEGTVHVSEGRSLLAARKGDVESVEYVTAAPVETLDGKRKCTICGFSTQSATYMSLHMHVHSHTRHFQCGYCTYRFQTKKAMLHHVRWVHLGDMSSNQVVGGTGTYPCDQCERVLPTLKRLENHMEMHKQGAIGPVASSCPECKIEIEDREEMNAHMQTHGTDAERESMCSYPGCETSLLNQSLLSRHIRLMHVLPLQPMSNQTNIQLDMSSASVQSADNSLNQTGMDNTPTSHSPALSLPNQQCSQTAGQGQGLVTYSCATEGCNYSTVSKSRLDRHQLLLGWGGILKWITTIAHQSDRPFKCPKCVHRFKQEEGAIEHLKRKHAEFYDELVEQGTTLVELKMELRRQAILDDQADDTKPNVVSEPGTAHKQNTQIDADKELELAVRSVMDTPKQDTAETGTESTVIGQDTASSQVIGAHGTMDNTQGTTTTTTVTDADVDLHNEHSTSALTTPASAQTTSVVDDVVVSESNVTAAANEAEHDTKLTVRDQSEIGNTTAITDTGTGDLLPEQLMADYVINNAGKRLANARLKPREYFECDVCLRSFDKPSKLVSHMRSHTGEKPWLCDVCGKGFSSRDSLRYHAFTYHSVPGQAVETVYQYDEGGNLIVREEPAEQYSCELCNKSFCMQRALQRHMASHQNDKEYDCDQCEATYKYKTSLDTHKKVEHGIGRKFELERMKPGFNIAANRYECDRCHQLFKWRKSLIRHVERDECEPRDSVLLGASIDDDLEEGDVDIDESAYTEHLAQHYGQQAAGSSGTSANTATSSYQTHTATKRTLSTTPNTTVYTHTHNDTHGDTHTPYQYKRPRRGDHAQGGAQDQAQVQQEAHVDIETSSPSRRHRQPNRRYMHM